MRILSILLVAAGALLPAAAHAETLSLDDLLASVRETHPLFRREARAVDIEAQARERALAGRDWRLASSATYAYQEAAGDDLFSPRSVQSSDLQVSLEKPLWSTGGRLGLSAGAAYSDADLRRLDFGGGEVLPGLPHAYAARAYLTYSQPLWRNRGGALDRLDWELAGDAVALARAGAAEAQEGFLLDVALRYLDWALLAEQREIAAARLRLAEEQLEQVRERREANLVDEVDILRAEDAVRAAEQGLLRITARHDATRAELAEIAQREDLYGLAPAFDLYAPAELPAADAAVAEILGRSRLLEATGTARQQIERRLAAAEETHDPDLSLDLGCGLRREETELADALALTRPDAFVALSLQVPLGRRAARSDIQTARLSLLQVEDEAREIAIGLESSLRALLIEIAELADVIRLDRERIESAQRRADEELRLYDQGRGMLTFVIAARDEVERAELGLAENAHAYQQLLLRYRELMDAILPAPAGG